MMPGKKEHEFVDPPIEDKHQNIIDKFLRRDVKETENMFLIIAGVAAFILIAFTIYDMVM